MISTVSKMLRYFLAMTMFCISNSYAINTALQTFDQPYFILGHRFVPFIKEVSIAKPNSICDGFVVPTMDEYLRNKSAWSKYHSFEDQVYWIDGVVDQKSQFRYIDSSTIKIADSFKWRKIRVPKECSSYKCYSFAKSICYPNRPKHSSKPVQFQKKYYVINCTLDVDGNMSYLDLPGSNCLGTVLPSYQEYLNKNKHWQLWGGLSKCFIDGTVDKNDSFRFENRHKSGNYITILDGKFKGIRSKLFLNKQCTSFTLPGAVGTPAT